MSKRAVVLAGGKGTRLQPYTLVLPKPLMPIGDYPILEVVVRQLAKQGFSRITLAVNHQANLIKAFFEDGHRWDVQIDYSLETTPLSTIAPLRLIPDLPDDFLLMNGDILTDADLSALFDGHVKGSRTFTISAAQRDQVIDYGVLQTNGDKRLTAFTEKPVMEYLVSMGLYVVNRRVLDYIPEGVKFGFDDLMHTMLRRQIPVHVEPYGGYWLDIGRPDDYRRAIDDFQERKRELLCE